MIGRGKGTVINVVGLLGFGGPAPVQAHVAADEVVKASLKGLELGEVICAPGGEDAELLKNVEAAELAAFHGQSPELASRYRE